MKVINFMGQRKLATAVSIVVIIAAIVSLAVRGLNFGLDFTGGTEVELHYQDAPELKTIREFIVEQGYPSAVVANFGSDRDILIRMQTESAEISDKDKAALGDKLADDLRKLSESDVTLKRVSYVGPQIGEELRDDGGIGLLFALAVVMVYVALRFQLKFSVGAVTALAHDVIIVLGLFSIFGLEFDLTVLAAVLAVIGYSLNDTIVVSDRIRENFRKIRGEEVVQVVNISLSQTLGRTLITSFTTLLVLFALFLVGGELIHNFSIALIVGILVGTYSSIYVAANILLALKISSEDLIVVEKEGEEFDEITM